jgi:hypothetical protein
VTLDCGGPGGEIRWERAEDERAVRVLSKLAVGLTAGLVDGDNGVAVVEGAAGLSCNLEGGRAGLGNHGIVLLQATGEGLAEVCWEVRLGNEE